MGCEAIAAVARLGGVQVMPRRLESRLSICGDERSAPGATETAPRRQLDRSRSGGVYVTCRQGRSTYSSYAKLRQTKDGHGQDVGVYRNSSPTPIPYQILRP